ncbi:MAG: YgiT-type zinc finger protein [Methanomicrobiales archaeon]|nr:YgiT-type zinc finger protein [Methanomicrobiales archaeon]
MRDIPAYVCERCHEAYFTPDISRIMDTIIEEAREGSLCMKPLAVSKVSM